MSNKTDKFRKLMIHFLHVCTINFGAITVYSLLDRMQPSLFQIILQQVYLPTVTYICNTLDLITGCEMLYGCTLFMTADIPVIRNNADSTWSMLAAIYCQLYTSTVKLVGTTKTTSLMDQEDVATGGSAGGSFSLKNEDGSAASSVMGDNAYSKLTYASIPTITHIIQLGVAQSPELEVFNYTCRMSVHQLSALMQMNPNKYNNILLSMGNENISMLQTLFRSNNGVIV